MKSNIDSLVSVVIPCYNHERYIQETIKSVINQTYENIELIIIDDGSKDNSVLKIQEMTESCKKRFVRFEFRSRVNVGLSATLNEALEWCEGEYYSAIASDDIMLSNKTEVQVNILSENPDIVGVFGAVQMLNSKGELSRVVNQPERTFLFNDLIYTDSFLPAPTQMFRLNAMRETKGFIEGMVIEDWYICLKILESGGKILYKNEVLCYYRVHESNTHSDTYIMGLGYLQVLNNFKHHEMFKHAYIKICWENVLGSLRTDFRLSLSILAKRISYKSKVLLKKVISK